jgi:hypothetical protein
MLQQAALLEQQTQELEAAAQETPVFGSPNPIKKVMALPEGWLMIEVEGHVVYVNSFTCAQQTSRPLFPAVVDDENAIEDETTEEDDIVTEDNVVLDVPDVDIETNEEKAEPLTFDKLEKDVGSLTITAVPEAPKKKEKRRSMLTKELDPTFAQSIQYEGYLLKESGVFKLMIKKYFVLKNNVFYVYPSKNEYLTSWGVDVKHISVSANTTVAYKHTKNTFQVLHDKTVWTMQAASKSDMDMWTSRISACVEFMKQNVGKNIVGVDTAGNYIYEG